MTAPASPSRPTVSACIIAFNEADRITPCLESLAWVDEVIVIDSRSTDATVEISEAHGAKVVVRDFPGHVEQKNFAVDQATCDWIISLDADERLSPELQAELQALLADEPDRYAAYSMPRLTWYLGRWIRHSGWYPDRKVRLWRRGKARWGGRNPHDRVEVAEAGAAGAVHPLRGDIHHFSYRDVRDHIARMNSYTTIMARERYAEGERFGLLRFLLSPFGRFVRHYLLKGGFRDGRVGLFIACLAAYYVLLRHLKMWELEHAPPEGPSA